MMLHMPSRRLAVLVAVLLAIGMALMEAAQKPAAQVPGTLVITGGTVITMDAGRRVLTPGAVAISGPNIAAVGPPAEIVRAYPHARIMDAADRVVLPGLINTHTHAPMVLYRGLADDLALKDWLERYIFPAEAATVAPAFVRTGTRLAALEMIKSGTTTYADMYYFEEEIARETKRAGMRGVLGETIIGFPSPDAKTPVEALRRAAAFIKEFAGDTLITPAVAPHSMYLLEKATLLAARDLAIANRVPLLIHLAETETELETSRRTHNASPVQFLETIGFWAPTTIAAHGVWVDDEDIATIRRREVGVAHNPESNMKLASGTAPVPKYLADGVAVGLGTDGAASNNDLDMFEAMRQAAFVHKLVTRDPRAVSAATALEMATIRGARVLGQASRIGSLEPGKRADVIVVRMDTVRQTPLYDPISHLVYVTRGDDVETTIVNGRVLMEGRRVTTLDEAAVLKEARAMAEEVRQAVRR
jgi:5-methylthioadenosine/S-adenosylhomocysteine deaminase